MAYTADQIGMQVWKLGSARVVADQYLGDGSTTFAKGDLIRINTSGYVKDAATDSDTAGACHGMILDDYATAPSTSTFVPVLLFGSDTELKTQIYAAAGGDAEPQDVTVGVTYTMRNAGSGVWSITTTSTKGIATVVAKMNNVRDFDPDCQADTDFGFVVVKFAQSIIDGRAA